VSGVQVASLESRVVHAGGFLAWECGDPLRGPALPPLCS
jgi:hypothetical protein